MNSVIKVLCVLYISNTEQGFLKMLTIAHEYTWNKLLFKHSEC